MEQTLWRLKGRSFDLSVAPLVMGVLNLTPDSFSDGSSYNSVDIAVAAAMKMVEDGADIIDVGGESTRPGADTVSAREELARVLPVIEALATKVSVPISIDTWKSEVAAVALNAGVEIVNDISAMTFDAKMLQVVAEFEAAVILMHSRGKPSDMQKYTAYSDIVSEVRQFLGDRIEAAVTAGIDKDKIVVDPGIGFGKSVSGNLEIIRRLGEFKSLGRPVLVGTSRKSFIGAMLNRDVSGRVFGTAATVAVSMMNGASIFRVHDVRAMRDTVDMVRAIMKS
ncbi:MAG: dihydropteroate synthase [Geobacteraceae bacterium]|nr:dihydropteroate synthase [Geobacteraceae bacterium]